MADRKISDLTALTAPASGDYLPIVDISEAAAANKNKRITIEELFRGVPLGTAAAPSIAIEGDENTGIYSPGADQLAISTNGTGRLFITSAGDVCFGSQVGANNDGSGISIYNTSFPRLSFRNSTTGNTVADGSQLYLVDSDLYVTNNENANIILRTNSTERLRITSTGQLSHIGAGSSSTPAVSFSGSAPVNSLVVDSSGRCGVGTSSPTAPLSFGANVPANNQTLLIYETGNYKSGFGISASGHRMFTSQGASLFFGHVSSSDGTTFSEKVTIDGSGRVGIGTSVPGSTLHIEAAGNTVEQRIFTSDNVLNATASLTFGTTPGTRSKAAIRLINSNTGNGSGDLALLTNDGSSLQNRLYITSAGNVGIGTANPNTSSKLHVADGDIFISKTTGYASLFFNFIGINTSRAGAIKKNYDSPFDLRIQGGNNAGVAPICFDRADGFENARFDDSGRLLVGTSTSVENVAGNLQVNGGSAVINTFIANSAAYRLSFVKSRSATFNGKAIVQSGDDLGRISFNGDDGVDYSSEAASIACQVDGTPGSDDMPGRLVFSTTADGASSPTERVLISSNGALLCGRDFRNATHDIDDQFVIQGNGFSARHGLNATAYTIGQNSNARVLRIGSGSGWSTTGVSLAAGGTSWGTYSDERLKTDIVELTGCLDSLKNVRCVSYRLTNVDEADSKKRFGVIAQDLVGKFDEALSASRRSDADETEYLSVQYTDLVPVLIQSLQEAMERIETLEAKVAALETK